MHTRCPERWLVRLGLVGLAHERQPAREADKDKDSGPLSVLCKRKQVLRLPCRLLTLPAENSKDGWRERARETEAVARAE